MQDSAAKELNLRSTPVPEAGLVKSAGLLVFEGGDGVEAGGSFSGESAERNADDH